MKIETSPQLGNAMSILSKALRANDDKIFLDAADSLFSICDLGKITSKFMPLALMYSAFSYEIAGESVRARNPYRQLSSEKTIPVSSSIEHEGILNDFNTLMYYFGIRDVSQGLETGNKLIQKIKDLNEANDPRFSDSNDDETLVFLGIIESLISYLECFKNYDLFELGKLSQFLEKYSERLGKSDASPWLVTLARLAVTTINEITPRSILKAKIPKPIGTQLVYQKIVEFWEPQYEAINNGILKGKNLLLTTPTATGKTLLSTLLASQSTTSEKTILISPTRTLAQETFSKASEYLQNTPITAAISTREKTNYDKNLSEYPVLVATYEKFASLLRRNILSKNELKSVVIDEAHYIADADRGIPLEFLIKDIRNSTDNQTQLVALSGMINEENALQLSEWINAKNVRSSWRPMDLLETVLLNGKLYHKNGKIESIPIGDIKTVSIEAKRFWLAKRIAIEERDKNHQCMIVVNSRSKAEQECQNLLDELTSSQTKLFETNIYDNSNPARDTFSKKIQNVEPELPPFAINLAEMIKNGIGYHHAGLPEAYRKIVESAVRNNAINILFTTSTLEAGVNLPVSTVVFPNLKSRLGKFTGPMRINRYKNLAGRAGRPGYDRIGRSIIISLDKQECDDLLENYVMKNSDEISSSIKYFLKKIPTPRYAIQSEILNMLTEKRSLTYSEILNAVDDTWFAKTENTEQMDEFRKAFSFELFKLTQYGCVKKIGNDYAIDKIGESARSSMLYAFSMTRMVRNLEKIIQYDDEKFDLLILGLVALPWELQSYDDVVKKIISNEKTRFIEDIITDDVQLYEQYQRSQFAPQFATVLSYWINSVPTTEIIQTCGLDDSHSAFVEEILKEDAYWILNAISHISERTIKIPELKKERIKQLAEFCKLGSSDHLVVDIFRLNLSHVYRSTAIKFASYFRSKSVDKITMKELQSIPKGDFLNIFPNNKESAEILYREIHA